MVNYGNDVDKVAELSSLCVVGGTFDPVHNGHIQLSHQLVKTLQLEKILIIPSHLPPHRKPFASISARLAMLTKALADEPHLMLDERELERPGPSYSVDTLTSLRSEYGAQRPIFFVVGQEVFAGFETWHKWQQLLTLANVLVICASRTVELSPTLARLWEKRIHGVSEVRRISQPAGCLCALDMDVAEISATKIRQYIHKGLSIEAMVPKSVQQYLYEHQIYRYCEAS